MLIGTLAGFIANEAIWSYIGGDVVVAMMLAVGVLFLFTIGVTE
jgi:hypothetical protein